eukprot:UN06409
MQNPLMSFNAGSYQFVVLNKEPFYLFAIHRTNETVHQIKLQLNLLYAQIVSVLTNHVVNTLRENASYDAREMLHGTELLSHAFINKYDQNMGLMAQVLESIKVHRNTRQKIFTA